MTDDRLTEIEALIAVLGEPPWDDSAYTVVRHTDSGAVRIAQIGEQLNDNEDWSKRFAATALLASIPGLVAQLRAANEALTAACDMLTDADFLSEYQRDLVAAEVAEWRQVLGDTETEEGT